tara:strand:+ start:541 stop:873 length:333 start_codon:yes stop_codon:yes gene_type:complete
MRITKQMLRQLIREEITHALAEQGGADWADATISWHPSHRGSIGRVVTLKGNVGGKDFFLNNEQIYGDQKFRDMSDWDHSPAVALHDVLKKVWGEDVSTVGINVNVKEHR